MLRACSESRGRAERLAAAVRAALRFARCEPERARLLVLDAVASDPGLGPEARALPELTERVLVGALASMIGAELAAGEGGRLAELEPELVEFVLTPYVGSAQSRRLACAP